MTNESIERTVKRVRAHKKRAAAQAKKAASDEKIKASHAPRTWQALYDWMEKHCANSNRKTGDGDLEFRKTDSNKFALVANALPNRPVLQATFDSQVYVIAYRIETNSVFAKVFDGDRAGTFDAVVEGTKFSFTDRGKQLSVKSMGETLLEALLK
jgi:hypothetical protein